MNIPPRTYRLIPSRFPPIGLFDTVATAADLQAVMDVAGWTNDRLVRHRLARLPESEWAHARPNSSVVMASFLHVAPGGMRFNGPDLGAWYAAASERTGIVEVAHHLRREAVATGGVTLSRCYRTYVARLDGDYLDLQGQQAIHPDIYDPLNYAAAQAFGENLRMNGGDGIVFDSLRHQGGTNIVAYRPSNVQDVTQGTHFELHVEAASPTITVRTLTT